MTNQQKLIIDEIQNNIQNNKGCIILDIAYFNNHNTLENFDFHILGYEKEPIKLNHRYPNYNYVTISKKTGRKISKIGYAQYLDLNCTDIIVEIFVNHQIYRFPITFHLSKNKPVCGISIRIFDNGEISCRSEYKCADGVGWLFDIWTNDLSNVKDVFQKYTTKIDFINLDNCLQCNTTLTVKAQKINDIILI